jgi:hypothetical protein
MTTNKESPTQATTYYHVTSKDYEDGDDLWCWDELELQGRETLWKWEEDQVGVDTDVVCLFTTRDDAQAFLEEWIPDGVILTITLPQNPTEVGLRIVHVAEGYPAIIRMIPSEYIHT